MRKGFIYIRLQIYFTLLVLVIGSAMFLAWNIWQKNLQLHTRLKENLLVQNVLDKMAEDILYAEKIDVQADRLLLTKDGVDYLYFLNNQRLARRKDANLYLTPAKIVLHSLSFEQENGILRLVLSGEKQIWDRMVRL
ncbi:hypothetical protein NO1_1355 [Candidatus Termititenax aidoneus]|uniref:Two-component sensor histidine kinase n=1 Tax=Termititenax aidoneus TaxID=2218524 RepID=A0A388TDX7_TERA1|nr:hypothetical protein NO1_1355 [Candidatus Termititenax aidoneus]